LYQKDGQFCYFIQWKKLRPVMALSLSDALRHLQRLRRCKYSTYPVRYTPRSFYSGCANWLFASYTHSNAPIVRPSYCPNISPRVIKHVLLCCVDSSFACCPFLVPGCRSVTRSISTSSRVRSFAGCH